MLSQVVTDALAAQPAEARDAAAAELARTYAALIDAAAPAGKYQQALSWLARQGIDDLDADKHIRTISQALAAHSVASDLGPKLLAALEALGLTPRARKAVKSDGRQQPNANPLDELAAARARLGRPQAVDTGAP